MTPRSTRRDLAKRFTKAGLPFADEDALDLVLGLCGLSRTDYALRGSDSLNPSHADALERAAERRLAGEPVDRILGWRDFYGRRFSIDGVLSPRGDTEVLLLAALKAIKNVDAPLIVDLGTGSGALIISLLCERPDARGVATDISERALETAAENARTHGVTDRLQLIRSDWFAELDARRFDAILSNPPYIDSDAMGRLAREVADFDPPNALHGGEDGLDPYRILLPGAEARLVSGGWLGVEIGFDQGDVVRDLFMTNDYRDVRVRRDPAGLDRVVEGRKAGISAQSGEKPV